MESEVVAVAVVVVPHRNSNDGIHFRCVPASSVREHSSEKDLRDVASEGEERWFFTRAKLERT